MTQSTILGFVADLMFTTRIESVAHKLGFQIKWFASAEAFGQDVVPEGRGEALYGRRGELFRTVTEMQPALLLFDLNNDTIPFANWIASLKSSPATRRIPVLCFGSHMDVDRMKSAKQAGADVVLARSKFTNALPQLLQKHARQADTQALADGCAQPLAALAREGIALFNEEQYYKCHDALEEAWRADSTAVRDLYRGILQVGIAYFQIERGNYRGALKMLLRVRQWLDPLPDVCREVNIAQLREDVTAVYNALITLTPEQIDQFDTQLFKKIEFIS